MVETGGQPFVVAMALTAIGRGRLVKIVIGFLMASSTIIFIRSLYHIMVENNIQFPVLCVMTIDATITE